MSDSDTRFESLLGEWRGAPCVFREMMCFARGTSDSLDWDGRSLSLQLRPDGHPGFWWPAPENPPVHASKDNILFAPSLLVLQGPPIVVHFDAELIDEVGQLVETLRCAESRDRAVAVMRLLLVRESEILGFVPS